MIALSPRHVAKVKKNSTKYRTSAKQDWRKWETLTEAIACGTELQVSAWTSFEDFRLIVAGHKTYDHMRVWLEVLFTGEDSRYLKGIAGSDTLVLSPRESAKSTFLAQWVSYQIGMHASPWAKIAFKVLGISYNIETALPRSRQIQAIIQSQKYQEIFPWILPSPKKWGEKEWLIDLAWAGLPEGEEQYSFVAGGLNGGLNSRRCHLVFLDDLVKSPESIRAQSVRDAMESTWRSVVQFCRYDGARAICLGTQMTANDIYCTEFTEDKKWRVIRQSALLEKPDGSEYSYWEPEDDKSPGTPLVRLQREREEMPVEFAFQRQNKIIRVKEQSINPELIQRGVLPSRFDSLVLGCDLSAGKKESNDYTTMVLGGILAGAGNTPDQYWIIDAWEDRIMGNIEKLDAMIEIWQSWCHLLPITKLYDHTTGEWSDRPITGLNVFFDSSAYGLSLQGDYEDYIIGQKKIVDWHVHPVPASGRGDKLYRLRKHTGLFTNKLVWFNLYGRTMSDGRKPMGRLIQQITEFGSTSHDDLCDSFELCVTGLRSRLPMSKGSY
jgi:phage terminase large subunit-like protein